MLLEERARRKARRRLFEFYPDEGPLRRELYVKHLEFFRLGKTRRERLALAANRVGKTEGMGGYETALHVTGLYPDWWEGRRFKRRVRCWVAGKNNETTRDIVQAKLFGEVTWVDGKRAVSGTGLIPGELIGSLTWKQGVPNLIDTARVKHAGGGWSIVGLKSYEQGRGSFEGTEQEVVWLDEEPPFDVYGECLIRTATTKGMVMLTFTPLEGMTETVTSFLDEPSASKGMVQAGWDDVPHLSAEDKRELWESTPAHLRKARAQGEPTQGSGLIFPVDEERISVPAFALPAFWPVIGGIDFGWDHPTAAVQLAWDRDADCVYITKAYKQSEATPVIHAAAVKPWGEKMPWAWPHDGLQHDKGSGEQLANQYKAQGLAMLSKRSTFPDGTNGVEAGLMDMLQRMQTGRLKVFANCADWFAEFRRYHRKDGKVVKVFDDLMSATRYALMMVRYAEIAQPDEPVYDYSSHVIADTDIGY